MRRWIPLLFSLMGCATTPVAKMTFEEVAKESREAGAATGNTWERALTDFSNQVQATRGQTAAGASMPTEAAEAWLHALALADRLLAKRASAPVLIELRRVLENELHADAERYGDIPPAVVMQLPRVLGALNSRLAPPVEARKVDPARFHWPLASVAISSGYGDRMHPIRGESRFHAGVDLEAARGEPVNAAFEGRVVFAGWNGAHGRHIEVQHDAHWTTRYSHLQRIDVRVGDSVRGGQRLGFSGASGLVTGPHLHFELRCDGDALDPEFFLAPPQESFASNGAR